MVYIYSGWIHRSDADFVFSDDDRMVFLHEEFEYVSWNVQDKFCNQHEAQALTIGSEKENALIKNTLLSL